MNQHESYARVKAAIQRASLAMLVASAAVAAPAMADPIDGGWHASSTRTNGQCFMMTTDHVRDDPDGMFGTSFNMVADDGRDVRMLLQWTPSQIRVNPRLPKTAGVVVELRFVSHDAAGH